MNIEELISFFKEKPSYLKETISNVCTRTNSSDSDVRAAMALVRKYMKDLGMSKLQEALDNNGLKLHDIKQVKIYGNVENPQISLHTKPEWYNKQSSPFEHLEQYIKENTKPVKLDKTPQVKDKKALFIYTSDRHLGAANLNTSLYENTYNENVYRERLLKTINIIQEEIQTFGKFDKIFICDLGDTSDGYNGYSTRHSTPLPQNLDNIQQIEAYYKYNKELFDLIVQGKYCNELAWVACSNSNHDGDFGYAMHKLLDVYLECKYPQVERYLFTKFIEHIDYGIHNMIFTHGKDKIHLKHGLPLTLNDKTEVFINDYITHKNLTHGTNHLIKGDLHQSSMQYGKNFRYKNVRSMYGASSWIMDNFGNNPAGVDYEIICKNRNKVYESRIFYN